MLHCYCVVHIFNFPCSLHLLYLFITFLSFHFSILHISYRLGAWFFSIYDRSVFFSQINFRRHSTRQIYMKREQLTFKKFPLEWYLIKHRNKFTFKYLFLVSLCNNFCLLDALSHYLESANVNICLMHFQFRMFGSKEMLYNHCSFSNLL